MDSVRFISIALGLLSAVLIALSVIYSSVRPGLELEEIDTTATADRVFRSYCGPCHGPDGGGTGIGVKLKGRKIDPAYVKRTVLTGNPKMPPIRNIHEPLLSRLAEYVNQLE